MRISKRSKVFKNLVFWVISENYLASLHFCAKKVNFSQCTLKRWLAWTVKVLSLSLFGKNIYFRAPLKKAELRRVTSMLKYWNYIIQIMKRPAILAMCSAQESSGLGQKKLKCFLNISLAPSTVQHTTQHLSLLVVDMKISDRIMGKLENVNDWWVMSPIVGHKKC